MLKYLKVFSFLRLDKVASILLGVLTISAYSYGSISILLNLHYCSVMAWALTALFFLLSAGYLMNDLCDLRYDQAHPFKSAYISRLITREETHRLIAVMALLGFVAAGLSGIGFLLAVILDFALLMAYNLFSKKLAAFKPIFISFIVISVYPLCLILTHGGMDSPRRNSLFIFPIWLFYSTLGYEILCDILDIRGDQPLGGKTLPVRIGEQRARQLAHICTAIAIPLASIPYVLGMCGNIYLIGVLISTVALLWHWRQNDEKYAKGILLYIRGITFFSLADMVIV